MTRTRTCRTGWRRTTALGLLALAACDDPTSPTRAVTPDHPLSAVATSALLPNTWTAVAQMPETLGRTQLTAGVATNAAGHSIAYVFGGRYLQTGEEPPATSILAYDATTDSWTTKSATFEGWATNGVGTIDGNYTSRAALWGYNNRRPGSWFTTRSPTA